MCSSKPSFLINFKLRPNLEQFGGFIQDFYRAFSLDSSKIKNWVGYNRHPIFFISISVDVLLEGISQNW